MRLLLIALLCSGCASRMETAWQTVHLVDGLQTLSVARDECYVEKAWPTRHIIGREPSEGEVVAWWAGTAALHALVSRGLERWPRWQRVWQSVTLTGSAYAVVRNHSRGIRIDGDNNHSQIDVPCSAAPDYDPDARPWK